MAEKNIVQTERIEEIEVTEDGDVNGLILLSEIATTTTPGIASFDSEDFAITEDGHVYIKQKVGAIQYIGLPERYSDTSNTENLIWSVNVELSPKRRVEIVRNDLIMASSDVEEFGVVVGDVFKVLSTIDGKILTDIKREFSVRGPIGETGKTGETGATGPQGPGGEVEIGTVKTLDTGESAYVIKDESKSTAGTSVLNFGLPKGDIGERGADGKDGERGADGKDGENAPGYVYMYVKDGHLYYLTNFDSGIEDFSLSDGNLIMEVA